jgi:hypothetical protein
MNTVRAAAVRGMPPSTETVKYRLSPLDNEVAA